MSILNKKASYIIILFKIYYSEKKKQWSIIRLLILAKSTVTSFLIFCVVVTAALLTDASSNPGIESHGLDVSCDSDNGKLLFWKRKKKRKEKENKSMEKSVSASIKNKHLKNIAKKLLPVSSWLLYIQYCIIFNKWKECTRLILTFVIITFLSTAKIHCFYFAIIARKLIWFLFPVSWTFYKIILIFIST